MMKDVLVFGSGKYYREIAAGIKVNYNVLAILDNDSSKHFSHCDGVKVVSPNEAHTFAYDEVIIASSAHCINMIEQLISMDISLTKINTSYIFDELYFNDIGEMVIVKDCITVKLTDSSESITMAELRCDYKEIEGIEEGILIDIGMNVGIVSMYYASKNYIKKVYAYEPFPATYDKALKNFQMNKDEIVNKISHDNSGLGYTEEVRYISVLRHYTAGNSTLQDNNSKSSNQDGIPVRIKNAADEFGQIISKNQNKKIICKIDTEGSEYEIFDTLNENGLISSISVFIMEYHPVKERSPDDIKQILLANGFILTESPMGDNWGMLEAINSKDSSRIHFRG